MAFLAYLAAAGVASWALVSGAEGEPGPAMAVAAMGLLFAALMTWAVLGLYDDLGPGRERGRSWLDAGLVVAAGSAFLLEPTIAGGAAHAGSPIAWAAYWLQVAFVLLLLLSLATLLVRRPAISLSGYFPLVAGLAASLGATMVLLHTPLPGTSSNADVAQGLRVAAAVCFALTGWRLMKVLPVHSGGRTRREALSPVPYVAFAAVAVVTIGRFQQNGGREASQIVLGLAALGVGMLTRLILFQRGDTPTPAKEIARLEEDRLRALLRNSSDLILVLRPDGAIRYLSPSVRRVLGYDETAMWAPVFQEFVHHEDQALTNDLLRRMSQDITGVSLRGEWRMRNSAGSWLQVEGIVTNYLTEPRIQGLLLNIRDITDRKVLEARLVHQALHDSLTGLANRALLLDRIQQALAKAKRRGDQVGLLFLDLDDFKQVNDTFGHPEGDRLLQEIASRLLRTCRTADTVARLGGDEFAVLLEQSVDSESVARLADRILDQLRSPYFMVRGQVIPTTSIGIAVAGGDTEPQELLRRADVAMYAAKSEGKNGVCYFEPEMDRPLRERVRLEVDLREAVRDWKLSLVYQPIVSLESGALVGVEALVRWQHPTLGILQPKDFLHIAEETGQMAAIGRRVLLDACFEVASWPGVAPDSGDIHLSVNVSAAQLRDPQLLAQVQDVLAKTRLAPHLLVLEVTETTLLRDQGVIASRLEALESLGVRIAIDDFGTHHSSLSYLRNLPVHVLKLDRSFVTELATDDKAYHIVRAVVELARALDVQLVAEGIERPEQRDELRRLGCPLGQGYHFFPPLPSYDMRQVLLGGNLGEQAALCRHEPDAGDARPGREAALAAQIGRFDEGPDRERDSPRATPLPAQLW